VNEEIYLAASNLTFRYFEQQKTPVIAQASLMIQRGTTTILTGVSGCGKSTLAAILAGLYPKNGGELLSGEIILAGHRLEALNLVRRSELLGMMMQNPELSFCMDTLRKEMVFCMENRQVPVAKMADEITKYSKRFGVMGFLDRKLHSLSGGEKQRAALCLLLLAEPKGVILDEPFANLDLGSTKEMMEILKAEQQRRSLTIIVIDHKPETWGEMADEVVELGKGGTVIKRQPMALWKTAFLQYQQTVSFPERKDRQDLAERESLIEMRNGRIFPDKKQEALLKNIDFTMKAGGIYALLGASGSGKTTLFLTLLGQKHYQGTIQVNVMGTKKQELRKLTAKRWFQKTGIVFQNPAHQFVTTRVIDEVLVSLQIWKPALSEEARRDTAKALLSEYGLLQYMNYPPYMLSQGQQRRLAVLAMLAGGQQILLLDEPTYGQDSEQVKVIMEMLRKKREQEGLTIIFTTHDTILAETYADEIYKVEKEQIVRWND